MDRDLDALWSTAEPGSAFDGARVQALPASARRYLTHAIAPGAPLARAARLRMHGEMRLNGRWSRFDAEQVIRARRGFVWRARVAMRPLPVRGSDRWVDGRGAMVWRLLGVVPVVRASGADVSRSAAGRFAAEGIWLPSALLDQGEAWVEGDGGLVVRVRVGDDVIPVELDVDDDGALRGVSMDRWGTPDGPDGPFRLERFGAAVDDERAFGAYTVPSRLRVGWYVGTDRFEADGEFFRVTIDDVSFR